MRAPSVKWRRFALPSASPFQMRGQADKSCRVWRRNGMFLMRRQIIEMQGTELFVHQRSGAGALTLDPAWIAMTCSLAW
jgi:hypothetical protein